MSKLPSADGATGSKRKRVSLSIEDKVTILKRVDKGASAKILGEEYGVGLSTIYDLKKQKDKILKFYADSDAPQLMSERKTLHHSKNITVDKVLIEWIKQRRSENFPLTRSLIMAQAKLFHGELCITTPCDYSSGWYGKFRKRNGLRILKVSGEKASADFEAAEAYVETFRNIINEEKLSPEQVYNADETSLYWRYIPRKTVALPEESTASGFKDSKERLTVLGCSNAAGTHKTKLLVIGKSKNPRALKGVKIYPVIYKANKRAWVTRDIFQDWFNNNFVLEARAHCTSIGFPSDAKIMLILDNCTAHPHPKLLMKDNVFAAFLPPNCTSILQPLDQGILRSLKTHYKSDFLKKMLMQCNKGCGIKDFQATFNIKEAIWSAANAWEKVIKSTLVHGWHNLWPSTIFLDDDDEVDFDGFRITKERQIVAELVEFAKGVSCPEAKSLDEEAINDCLNVDIDAPVSLQMTDSEICEMVANEGENFQSDESDSDQSVKEQTNISTERMLELTEELIRGMEQRSFYTEQQIMSVYKIQEQLVEHRRFKQPTLEEMFKKTSKFQPQHSTSVSSEKILFSSPADVVPT